MTVAEFEVPVMFIGSLEPSARTKSISVAEVPTFVNSIGSELASASVRGISSLTLKLTAAAIFDFATFFNAEALVSNVTKKSSSAGDVSSVKVVIAAVVIPVALPSKVPATKVSEPTVHLSELSFHISVLLVSSPLSISIPPFSEAEPVALELRTI